MSLTTFDDEEVSLALRAQLESVAELPPPADRAWNNVDFKPAIGRPYVRSEYLPPTRPVITTPADGGLVDANGFFVVTLYAPAQVGDAPMWAFVRGVLAAFRPGSSLALASDNTLRIASGAQDGRAPYPGQILPAAAGFSRCTITIPWRAQARNLVTA